MCCVHCAALLSRWCSWKRRSARMVSRQWRWGESSPTDSCHLKPLRNKANPTNEKESSFFLLGTTHILFFVPDYAAKKQSFQLHKNYFFITKLSKLHVSRNLSNTGKVDSYQPVNFFSCCLKIKAVTTENIAFLSIKCLIFMCRSNEWEL